MPLMENVLDIKVSLRTRSSFQVCRGTERDGRRSSRAVNGNFVARLAGGRARRRRGKKYHKYHFLPLVPRLCSAAPSSLRHRTMLTHLIIGYAHPLGVNLKGPGTLNFGGYSCHILDRGEDGLTADSVSKLQPRWATFKLRLLFTPGLLSS